LHSAVRRCSIKHSSPAFVVHLSRLVFAVEKGDFTSSPQLPFPTSLSAIRESFSTLATNNGPSLSAASNCCTLSSCCAAFLKRKCAGLIDVNVATVYRWMTKLKHADQVSALLSRKRGMKQGRVFMDAAVEQLIQEEIEQSYLNELRLSPRVVARRIFLKCRERGYNPPSEGTIRNRIRRLPQSACVERRIGRQAARQRFHPKLGHLAGADHPYPPSRSITRHWTLSWSTIYIASRSGGRTSRWRSTYLAGRSQAFICRLKRRARPV
jgi:hypothetical protein